MRLIWPRWAIEEMAMPDSRGNVETLRQAYQLWNDSRGESVQSWLDRFAEDITIHSLGGGKAGLEFGKSRHGKVEAEVYFAELGAAWEMIYFTPEEFIADRDRVVVLSRCAYRSRLTGKVAESPKVDIFRFRDGKIVEVSEFFDTAAAVAATLPDLRFEGRA
jgi:ketosteroid isomerase-like protein